MDNSIKLNVNGKHYQVEGEDAFMPLADFIRYRVHLTGTKIVCAEGDCGACTILVARPGEKRYQSINSCIGFVFQFHGSSIITVEGLQEKSELHPIQESMRKFHGSQCGYCTPGIICSLAQLTEDAVQDNFEITKQKTKNYLTGNLCRCTGYEPILDAATHTDLKQVQKLTERYPTGKIKIKESVGIETVKKSVFIPTTLIEAVDFKNTHPDCRIVSGATDLGVLSNKGRWEVGKVMYLGLVKELKQLRKSKEYLEVGAAVSLEGLRQYCEQDFSEFAELLHVFASPQIKNAGTLVGNLANGSPIGDTIPFLLVADALIELVSVNGARTLNLNDFYLGYKTFAMKPGEVITKVLIPRSQNKIKLYKVAMRKDLDISAVTFAANVDIEAGKVKDIKLALGGVGPTVLRMKKIEKDLIGNDFSKENFQQAAVKIKDSISPFSDVRGSAAFRKQLCHNLMLKCFEELQ
jgi:xanthine dehydrogenase small subunit